jgi:hypothetical protein
LRPALALSPPPKSWYYQNPAGWKERKVELSSVFAYRMDALMLFEGATVNGKKEKKNPHYRSASLSWKKATFETIRGPQTGMLPRLDLPGAQGAFKDSMIRFCNSHYLSQFAAFFIDGRTKRSVAKSCFFFRRPHYQP